MTDFNAKQLDQEADYYFPYHYQDLRSDGESLVRVEMVERIRIVRDIVLQNQPRRVLDIGCGDGRFCFEMRQDNVELVGLDHSERALRFASAFNPQATFHCMDLTELDRNQPFDAAVMIEVLEHLPPNDIPQLLRSIRQCLRPGGYFVVTVPSTQLPVPNKHYQHFTADTLKQTLSQEFVVERIEGFLPKTLRLRLFSLMLVGAYLLYPARNHVPALKNIASFVHNYFRTRVALGSPDNSQGLIAICRNRTPATAEPIAS